MFSCFTEGTKLTCFSFPPHLLLFLHLPQPTHTAIRITPSTTDEGKFEGQEFQRLCSVLGYVYIQTVTYSDTLTHILTMYMHTSYIHSRNRNVVVFQLDVGHKGATASLLQML